jgi:phospholipid/cholesterol/gamma-HCH transport system substrate-binding protein
VRRGRPRVPHFLAGVVTIVAVVGGAWMAFAGVPFQGGHELRAVFASAPEIGTRSPVRIAGVEVGKVTRVERGEGATAVVTMELDDAALPVHADATVRVRPRIFLEGNFFLDLRPGTPGGRELDEGDAIPVAQTSAAVQLDEVLSALDSDTRASLQAVLHELRTGLDGGGAQGAAAGARAGGPGFRGLAQLAEDVRGSRDGDLVALVRDGRRVADTLAARSPELTAIVAGLTRTTRGLSRPPGALAGTARELDALTAEALVALPALAELVPEGRRVARALVDPLERAPAALGAANGVLDQAEALLAPGELPRARRALAPAAVSLARLRPRLVTVFDLLRPVSECLRKNALPALQSSVEDPPHTTGLPVYQEFLHAITGLASASQDFDANGAAVRYHANFGHQTLTTGRLPATNEVIYGIADQPLLGSRPRSVPLPPFRPDVPCETQDPPDLRAATAPPPPQRELTEAERARLRRGGDDG